MLLLPQAGYVLYLPLIDTAKPLSIASGALLLQYCPTACVPALQSSLMGPSLNIPIQQGRLALGTWQGKALPAYWTSMTGCAVLAHAQSKICCDRVTCNVACAAMLDAQSAYIVQ